MEQIKFWDQREEYGWLSNFHHAPIVLDNKQWPTSEHFYQAQKHTGKYLYDAIHDAPTAAKAKRLAKKEESDITEAQKIFQMRRAIHAKFTQNEDLRDKLISTGSTPILEDSPYDYYWGTGETGSGINMMGMLLMELRCQLQQGI